MQGTLQTGETLPAWRLVKLEAKNLGDGGKEKGLSRENRGEGISTGMSPTDRSV